MPADARVITAKDLFVNQSALTGESFPVEKTPAPVKVKDPSITEWSNYLFMGNIHRERHSHGALDWIRISRAIQDRYGNVNEEYMELLVQKRAN